MKYILGAIEEKEMAALFHLHQRIIEDTGHPSAMLDAFLRSKSCKNKFRTENYSPKAKNAILAYMKAGSPYVAGGYVFDCVKCKETEIPGVGYDDGIFSWDSQDIYHIDKYNAAVTNEFYEHVMTM